MVQIPRPQVSGSGVERALDLARAEPLATLGVVAVVLLVIGAFGWWLLRRRAPARRLQRVLVSREEAAVLMHPNPDPDAMASALGVAALAADVDTETTIYYPGQIRHQENRAFRTVLDLDFERVSSSVDLDADCVVLVDHNQARGFPDAASVDPAAVVDHHPGNGTGTAFTDVRTDYGSCASIVAEYFRTLDAEPGPEETEELTLTTELATGLLYGVLSDTNHLTRGCSSTEFAASAYLYPGIDEDVLDRIANPKVDAEVLDVKARAITDREVRGPFAVCDVGTVSNLDAIPQAADELVQLEGVSSVVVYGEKDSEIHLSGRSRDDRVHMGNALQVAVSDVPMASAGGHARMGGGRVSVADDAGLAKGVARSELTDRLFDAMVGDR